MSYNVYASTEKHPQPYWTCCIELEDSEAKTIQRRRKDPFGRYPIREKDIKGRGRRLFPWFLLEIELERDTELAVEIPELHS